MKILPIKAVGFFLVMLALAATTMAADLTGTYKCAGDNGNGGDKYTGTVEIVKKGDTFSLTWKLGDDSYTGIGILEGDVLAVSFYGSISGIVVYKVGSDSSLVGKWATTKGDGTLSNETLIK